MSREIAELREVIQKLVPLLTGKGLTVTQRGSQAYVRTDTVTRKPVLINIPNISDNASPEFIRAIQGFIDHEVAHVLHTDWNYYGGAPSAADLQDPKVRRFVSTHNIVEDTMIEREIVKTFPGSRKNLHDLREHFIERITKPALAAAKDDNERFSYLLPPVMRALAGHEEFQEFMDKSGLWSDPMVDHLVKSFKPQTLRDLKTVTTTKETLAIARELHGILFPPSPPPPPPSPAPPAPAPTPPEKENEDEKEDETESQDLPEKEAGEGEGDGERDHQEADEQEKDAPADDEDDADGKPNEEGDDAGEPVESEDEEGEEADERDDSASAKSDDAGEEDDDVGTEDEEDGDGDEGSDGDDAGDEQEPAADGEDAEDGDVGSAGGNEEGDETDASGAASDKGDSEDDGEGEAGDSNEERSQTHDEDAGSAPDIGEGDEDPEQGDPGGGGAEVGRSMFDFDDDAFEGADMSSRIATILSGEAVDSMAGQQYNVFTRELDRIEHLEPPVNMNEKWVPDLEDEVRSMTGRMQKDIERLMASQSHIIRTPGHKVGKLHGPSLFRVSQGDARVFTQRQEHKSKDTAVTLLIDNSGSMSGDKMRTAMVAGFALSQTLERVNIAHEVLGFTTGDYYSMPASLQQAMQDDIKKSGVVYHRTLPITMPIYKDFDERVSATVKRRIAYAANAQKGLQANIDGESLEYAAMRLAKRREKRKVIMVLSDGYPAGAHNAGPHLKLTVEKLTKAGFDCIGIGIMDGSVKHYYPKHAVLRSVEDLPGEVMNELKKILA